MCRNLLFKSCFHAFRCKRDLPQAGAGRVKNRIRNGSRRGNMRRFTGTKRGLIRTVDEDNVNFGDF